MMGRKKSISLTDDVRQDAEGDPRERAAAWMVFTCDSLMEFFDSYREARDFADGVDEQLGELEESTVVFPMYAGAGIVEQE
jgi:hypothetical protein